MLRTQSLGTKWNNCMKKSFWLVYHYLAARLTNHMACRDLARGPLQQLKRFAIWTTYITKWNEFDNCKREINWERPPISRSFQHGLRRKTKEKLLIKSINPCMMLIEPSFNSFIGCRGLNQTNCALMTLLVWAGVVFNPYSNFGHWKYSQSGFYLVPFSLTFSSQSMLKGSGNR